MFKPFRVLTAVAMTALLHSAAQAQFEEGDNVLGLGVGLLGGYGVGYSGSAVTTSPSLNLHFDHGMGDLGPGTWGLGGYLGYKSIHYKSRYFGYYDQDYRYTFVVIGARGTWHYNEWHGNEKLDTYGGLMLSYKIVSFTDDTNYGIYVNDHYTYSGSGVDAAAFVGIRYWFSDKFGGYSELGYGLSFLQAGLAFKL